MTGIYPLFPGAGAKVRIFPPGTRTVAVPRLISDMSDVMIVANMDDAYGPELVIDYVHLTPHMRGDQIVFAGYHAPSDTWYYTDD